MKIFSLLKGHEHYWGVVHSRSSDDRLIQTCYECGAEREVKVELRPSPLPSATDHGDSKAA